MASDPEPEESVTVTREPSAAEQIEMNRWTKNRQAFERGEIDKRTLIKKTVVDRAINSLGVTRQRIRVAILSHQPPRRDAWCDLLTEQGPELSPLAVEMIEETRTRLSKRGIDDPEAIKRHRTSSGLIQVVVDLKGLRAVNEDKLVRIAREQLTGSSSS